jgi:hypothetical protein
VKDQVAQARSWRAAVHSAYILQVVGGTAGERGWRAAGSMLSRVHSRYARRARTVTPGREPGEYVILYLPLPARSRVAASTGFGGGRPRRCRVVGEGSGADGWGHPLLALLCPLPWARWRVWWRGGTITSGE